jgi:hypothetical protein
MAKYFNYFPKTFYSLEDTGSNLETITNVIARFAFEDRLKENSAAFYRYQIKDSDTPEIIASKYYDSPERHWVVLLFNNIIDPQWDWPLTDRVFNEYVDKKYSAENLANSAPQYANTANSLVSGLTWAKTIDEERAQAYFKVITTTTTEKTTIEKLEVDRNTYNNDTIMQIGTKTYPLDDGTNVNIKITKEFQTFFDYEKQLNENKRSIKLLKSDFIPALEKEFKKIIKQ